jgi:hypothetical protein
LLGAANSIIMANPANIAQDTVYFRGWYSPGQYLIPGAISLLGVPLGIAMTLTVTLSMLASLTGWSMVVRKFAPRTSLALLVTIFIGLFPYSTAAFEIYHGGEILLQAATPWLILEQRHFRSAGTLLFGTRRSVCVSCEVNGGGVKHPLIGPARRIERSPVCGRPMYDVKTRLTQRAL